MIDSSTEVRNGDRFAFGANWSRFLEVVDEDRIREAEISLQSMLKLERLDGLTFLDVGCGSGLFSLAARRLGAIVHSFDFDSQSVATSAEMRNRYCDNNKLWQIETGSVLDKEFVTKLGQFDIVYSWGVLHHTGDMWQAMKNVEALVSPKGHLFIALYNDQDFISNFWLKIKRFYCSGRIGRILITPIFSCCFALGGLIGDSLSGRNPIKRYTNYRRSRGMSITHDWIDWFGGYPYQTAKPEEVFDFFFKRGFNLDKLKTRQSLGCNEFVFLRNRECSAINNNK